MIESEMEFSSEMPTLEELAMSLNALMAAYKALSVKADSRTDSIESAVLKVVNLIELRCTLNCDALSCEIKEAP